MGMSNAVRVSIRVRPFNRREIAAQAELSVKVFINHRHPVLSFLNRSTELSVRLFTIKKQKRLAMMNVFGHMTSLVYFLTFEIYLNSLCLNLNPSHTYKMNQ